MEIPNRRELQQIALNHSSDIKFKDFMRLYNDYKFHDKLEKLKNIKSMSKNVGKN